jgi:hypothetical protein
MINKAEITKFIKVNDDKLYLLIQACLPEKNAGGWVGYTEVIEEFFKEATKNK